MFKETNSRLIEDFESIKSSFDLVMTSTGEAKKRKSDKLVNFLVENKLIKDKKIDVDKINESPEFIRSFIKLSKESKLAGRSHELLLRNYLVAIISQFDSFVGNLAKDVLYEKPDILNSSDRQILFSELINYDTIENAKEFIVHKEVETLLRKSHIEQFQWFESKLGIKIDKKIKEWPIFIESTQRRNLYVHGDGVVSDQYLTICRNNGIELPAEYSTETTLKIDSDYFSTVYNNILILGLKLGHVIWAKLKGKSDEAPISFLNRSLFTFIQTENYESALKIVEFVDTLPPNPNKFEAHFMASLNAAQLYKWMNLENKMNKILDATNWMLMDDLYKLAYCVLKEQNDEAYKIMRRIGCDHQILTKYAFKEWPLFKRIKSEEGFQEAYEAIFFEPFLHVENDQIGGPEIDPFENWIYPN